MHDRRLIWQDNMIWLLLLASTWRKAACWVWPRCRCLKGLSLVQQGKRTVELETAYTMQI